MYVSKFEIFGHAQFIGGHRKCVYMFRSKAGNLALWPALRRYRNSWATMEILHKMQDD